ncbi:hypothetical protein DSO57_1005498 [Entomophthora muscae]|uniref:Uncharacterized protein n=1 Tax=Entomophthora muscae TaxID=34485 RepID=A0ACC2U6H3_9FUNG|nr:hypothetical protein DSO57_1005498 [Entomophthora muscae]
MTGFIKAALLVVLAAAQTPYDTKGPTPDVMARCAEEKKCDLNTIECRALCAGVPSPSAAKVDETTTCVANCNKDDAEKYKSCSQNCINKHFRKIEIPQPMNKTSYEKTDNSTMAALSTSHSTNTHVFAAGSIFAAAGTLAFACL